MVHQLPSPRNIMKYFALSIISKRQSLPNTQLRLTIEIIITKTLITTTPTNFTIQFEVAKLDQCKNYDYLRVLKEVFHYSEFRPKQLNIIQKALSKDQLVCMATGNGKSILYKLLSLCPQKRFDHCYKCTFGSNCGSDGRLK